MQVSFNNAAPGAYPVLGPECVTALFDQTALNHGLWSVFTTPPSGASPTFSATAYNRSYSNPQSGFTIMSKYLSNPWTLEGVCVPASPITAIQRSGMTTLNTGLQLAIAQALTPLPIDLLSFDAYPKAKSITLKFVTASEVNNRGFEIQRSLSPPEFKNIGWVDGHGTTSEIHEYSFDDRDVVPNNTYYYRLKQIDFDGKSEFSEIVAAKITGSNFFMNVIPNPYSGKTNITFSLESEADVSIEVLNTMGQRVAILDQGMKAKGDYRYDFSAKEKGYATGMYTVRVTVNGEVHSKRIVELD